jgi:hypothetical protein
MESNKRMEQYFKDTSNLPNFEDKIYSLFKKEFEEKMENILLYKDTEFMNNLTAGVCIDLEDMYTSEVLGERLVKDLLKKYESIIQETLYIINFIALNKAWNDYVANTNNFLLLSHYRKHCRYTNAFAKHSCDGYFIQVIDHKDETVKYVICVECKKSYQSDAILMYCKKCDVNYFSTVVPNNESIDIMQATWDKYHCNTMKSERMHCIKCKEIFYYDMKEDKLLCLKCKFKIPPLEIYWKCVVCSSEFATGARPYNPMEYKFCKQAVRQALLIKQRAQPYTVPCCKVQTYSAIFFHKAECRGELYQGEYDKKTIVVCSMCKTMNFYDNFLWTCPVCLKRFKQKVQDNPIEIKNFKVSSYEKPNLKEEVLSPDKRPKSFCIKDEQHQPSTSASKTSSTSIISVNAHETHGEELGHKKEGKLKTLIEILEERKRINSMKQNNNITAYTENIVPLDTEENNFLKKLNMSENELKQTKSNETVSAFSDYNHYNKIAESRNNQQQNNVSNICAQNSYIEENNNNNVNVIKRYVINDNQQHLIKSEPFKEQIKEQVIQYDKRIPLSKSPTPIIRSNYKIVGNPHQVSRSPDFPVVRQIHSNNRITEQNINVIKKIQQPAIIKVVKDEKYEVKISSLEGNKQQYVKPLNEGENINNIATGRLNKFDVDDYKIIKQIGEGSYGKIYLVEDKQKNKFAMKKIIAHSGYELGNFKQEFELVHESKHEGIMKLYGIASNRLDSTTFSLYILMELAQYDWDYEIKSRLRERKPYSEEELRNIVKQLVPCLAWLQKRNISHRDLKPQNVLCFGKGVYKLADFGEAKEVKIVKQLNTIRGTELYMAPILFDGLKMNKDDIAHNTYKSDVFSLGYCLLYAANLNFNCLHEIRELTNTQVICNIVTKYLKNKYSSIFIELVLNMIDLDENRRYDFVELDAFISKHF